MAPTVCEMKVVQMSTATQKMAVTVHRSRPSTCDQTTRACVTVCSLTHGALSANRAEASPCPLQPARRLTLSEAVQLRAFSIILDGKQVGSQTLRVKKAAPSPTIAQPWPTTDGLSSSPAKQQRHKGGDGTRRSGGGVGVPRRYTHQVADALGDGEQQARALDRLAQRRPAHGQHHHVPQEAVEVVLRTHSHPAHADGGVHATHVTLHAPAHADGGVHTLRTTAARPRWRRARCARTPGRARARRTLLSTPKPKKAIMGSTATTPISPVYLHFATIAEPRQTNRHRLSSSATDGAARAAVRVQKRTGAPPSCAEGAARRAARVSSPLAARPTHFCSAVLAHQRPTVTTDTTTTYTCRRRHRTTSRTVHVAEALLSTARLAPSSRSLRKQQRCGPPAAGGRRRPLARGPERGRGQGPGAWCTWCVLARVRLRGARVRAWVKVSGSLEGLSGRISVVLVQGWYHAMRRPQHMKLAAAACAHTQDATPTQAHEFASSRQQGNAAVCVRDGPQGPVQRPRRRDVSLPQRTH